MFKIIEQIKSLVNQKRKANKYIYAAAVTAFAVLVAVTAIPAVNTVIVAANSPKRKLPIYCVETAEKLVSVSFDAAWGADDTGELLEILKEFNVRATFFLCGYWVDKYPEEVKAIHAAGHDIGNHGDTHAHGAKLSLEQNKNEILGVHNKVRDLLGIEINLFRPPYGEYNNTVIEAAEALNYYVIQWDVDSHDWMNKGTEYEINQVLNNKNLGDGSIILFHNDAKDTPKTLRTILQGLIDKGYKIVPISELIHKENYQIDHTGRQKIKK